MEEEGNREDEDEDGQSRGGRGLRWLEGKIGPTKV
jgi:hypothetical protein